MDLSERKLTEEEKGWVLALIEGKKTKEVAQQCGLKMGTLAFKLNSLRNKYHCKNTLSLVAFLYKNKLID